MSKTFEKIKKAYVIRKYDFSKCHDKLINHNTEQRSGKHYYPWSVENILSIYIKIVLDRAFHIRYPNRNIVIKELFETLKLIKGFRQFTILRIDFKQYFESLIPTYIYNNIVEGKLKSRIDDEIIKEYCKSHDKCNEGLPLSNALAEIIGMKFDSMIRNKEREKGLIFYSRYVDDCILIYNTHNDKVVLRNRLDEIIDKIYKKNKDCPCNVEISNELKKYQYITDGNNLNAEFNYLGYNFHIETKLNNKNKVDLTIKYGITDEKMEKYRKKIFEILQLYQSDMNLELLRHRLRVFCRRIVYRDESCNHLSWKSVGFISTYGELRFHLGVDAENNTEEFLKNVIAEECKKVFEKHHLPYFLKTAGRELADGYTLYGCMKRNSALIFDEEYNLGIPKESLINMCKQIGIECSPGDSYKYITDKYLSKVYAIAKTTKEDKQACLPLPGCSPDGTPMSSCTLPEQ